ncbi:hypothetical protein I302_104809 [Kwoniella bestiolae CBS 10118]|uniref:Uncharacterized protein n=1 Tax=Kwoniella bestiolae CBS 10118 TaxID=1296100 RepID=A0AAJ8M8I4_9TREE
MPSLEQSWQSLLTKVKRHSESEHRNFVKPDLTALANGNLHGQRQERPILKVLAHIRRTVSFDPYTMNSDGTSNWRPYPYPFFNDSSTQVGIPKDPPFLPTPEDIRVRQSISNIVANVRVIANTASRGSRADHTKTPVYDYHQFRPANKDYINAHMSVARSVMPQIEKLVKEDWQSRHSGRNLTDMSEVEGEAYDRHLDRCTSFAKVMVDNHSVVKPLKQEASWHWLLRERAGHASAPYSIDIAALTDIISTEISTDVLDKLIDPWTEAEHAAKGQYTAKELSTGQVPDHFRAWNDKLHLLKTYCTSLLAANPPDGK